MKLKALKEFMLENIEHSHIEKELGDKGVNVHKFEPSKYKFKTGIHVTGDNDVLSIANNHLKTLGLDKEYVAIHKPQKLGSAPQLKTRLPEQTHDYTGD